MHTTNQEDQSFNFQNHAVFRTLGNMERGLVTRTNAFLVTLRTVLSLVEGSRTIEDITHTSWQHASALTQNGFLPFMFGSYCGLLGGGALNL